MKQLICAIIVILTACTSSRTIKDGRVAYAHKQYAVAIPLLEEEYINEKDKKNKAELAYFLGESHRNNNQDKEAAKWYDKAVEQGYGAKALYEMAYILKKLEKYDVAARYFEEILKYSDRKEEIRKEILKCKQGKQFQSMTIENDYEITSMAFNSESSEYSPQYYGPETLVYTSDKKGGLQSEYKWTGRGFSDIMSVNLSTGSSTDFSSILNTKDNEGSAVFNKARDKVYFTRCYEEESDHFCRILMSKKKSNSWSLPEEVFPMDPTLNYRDPVLIENDSVIIFSCDDPKGYGATDLYYSVIDSEGKWSAPDLMPPSINTIGFERFPTSDGDTLYFSSSFLAGFGGLDIFKTYLKEDNSWSKPINIGAPFNSSGDDFGYIVSPYPKDYIAKEGYFTSDRNGNNKDDIYHFIKRSKEKIDTTSIQDIIPEEENKTVTTILRIRVLEDSYAIADDPNSLLLGQNPVSDASVIVRYEGGQVSLTTDKRGYSLLSIGVDTTYRFLAGKKGYLNGRGEFAFSSDEIDIESGLKTFSTEVVIDKIFPNVEIKLDDIYYDFNESFIRDDAKPALDELYSMLVDNPVLTIQLSSHTDCQGENDYNLDLSQRRAEAAMKYIIDQGIPLNRIVAKGYGETQLAIDCNCDDCSEDEHQLNRRTTFKILK